jgi:hypothetical protein
MSEKRAAGARRLLTALAALAALSACSDMRPQLDVASAQAPAVSAPLVSGFPRLLSPGPSDAMPDEEVACRRDLRRLGVGFRDLPPIREGACGIDHPVEVSRLPGGIDLKPAATLNCRMALTFSRWTREELQPAARLRYLSSVASIHQASAYACRNMIGASESKLSEHASGNALDVSAIFLSNGDEIDVRKPRLFAFRQRSLLNTVRGDACDYFSTVLGPGYNREHKNHFHFDLRPRKGGRTSCN